MVLGLYTAVGLLAFEIAYGVIVYGKAASACNIS
jgi:hypothetical protein